MSSALRSAEVALGRAPRDRGVELDAAVALKALSSGVVGASRFDHQDRLHVRGLRQNVGDTVGVLALVDQRDHVGVLEQVAQLALDVAVVHVDQDRARLDDAQHRDTISMRLRQYRPTLSSFLTP